MTVSEILLALQKDRHELAVTQSGKFDKMHIRYTLNEFYLVTRERLLYNFANFAKKNKKHNVGTLANVELFFKMEMFLMTHKKQALS